MRAIDAATGKVIWEKSYAAPFEMTSGDETPRARPEIDADLCRRPPLHARHEQHRHGVGCRDRAKSCGASPPDPLQPHVSHGDVAARRSRADDSARRRRQPGRARPRSIRRPARCSWSWTGDGPAYGSPIIAEIGGTRQVIVFSQKNLVGVNPANGAAALERAVRVAFDDQLDYAARRTATRSSCRVRASR